MTPATRKNLDSLVGKPVTIEWSDGGDWPYFTLLKVSGIDNAIKLRGEDFPDGRALHEGDVFWADLSTVRDIAPTAPNVGGNPRERSAAK